MRMVVLSNEVNKRLLAFIESYLRNTSVQFRQDVLYTVRITAPLRERSFLVRLAAEISEVEWEEVEPFAFAAEILMISALTADDVIDGSPARSNEQSLLNRTDSSRAFLVAEYLHSVAYDVLCQRSLTIEKRVWDKVANEFRTAFRYLLIHQYSESSLQCDGSVTLEQIDELARGRTGRLLEACLVAPAIISESEELATYLSECGKWLGMAFQHRDDILDFIGNPKIIGKPILLNLLDGQPNIVLSHALIEANNESTRNIISKYYGERAKYVGMDNSESVQAEVVNALRICGSLDYARKIVRDYCARALYAINNVHSSQAKKELQDVINIVGNVEFPWEEVD